MDDSIGCSLRSDDEGKHYQNPLIERVSAITAGKRSLAPGLSVGVVDALKKIKLSVVSYLKAIFSLDENEWTSFNLTRRKQCCSVLIKTDGQPCKSSKESIVSWKHGITPAPATSEEMGS
ncbi:uncharacterized protein [Triticum aestivum]|uniref:uncharacterized protein isoform X1 n=1 Tax=Triticum aestivum TaxID=4565 RepID=UPI001D01F10F|nr:uncharacterized protein LOC123091992 isoform X1 [Triticum aestivum]